MRNAIDSLVLLAVLAFGGFMAYTHQEQVHALVRLAQNTIAPCSQPITYSIEAVDPRFHISTSTLLADIKEAEAIWESGTKRNFFQYVPEGGEVALALVYDERQASADTLRAAGIEIHTTEGTYHALKGRYDSLVASVQAEQSQYQAAVAQYKRDESAYNSDVASANAHGGARPAEYQRLQADKAALEQKFMSIKSLEQAVNADVDTINALATTLNQLIVQLNLNVNQYNRTGAAQGEFEEGLYKVDAGIQSITVYEYTNHVQLVRVLAHELGHALGLDHVTDPEAIMYKVNSGEQLKTTAADTAELHTVCKIK